LRNVAHFQDRKNDVLFTTFYHTFHRNFTTFYHRKTRWKSQNPL